MPCTRLLARPLTAVRLPLLYRGFADEALVAFLGGISDTLAPSDRDKAEPAAFFTKLTDGVKLGWTMSASFSPQKGAAVDVSRHYRGSAGAVCYGWGQECPRI